ncbi:MAG: FIST C-terminal domain-containing protein [Planctomycetota bacterium]|jgi:hypothetical protein|nr:FIST C-terminal domain-containing protein [Planctomycetota bacterium]
MHAGVGFSDNIDTDQAGAEAARAALDNGGQMRPCDLVFMFSARRHNPRLLRKSVTRVVGPGARVIGGGGMGVITSDRLGYAGNEVGIAAIWLDRTACSIASENCPQLGELEAGRRLGNRMAGLKIGKDSPFFMFYDTGERIGLTWRSVFATPLIRGIEDGVGFMPALYGFGMLGEAIYPKEPPWTADSSLQSMAVAVSFSGSIRLDSLNLNGCRPATGYYRVTKADGRKLYEIEGQPAVAFVSRLLGPNLPVEKWPLFLVLGMNYGDAWGSYDEDAYASFLCIEADPAEGSLTLAEPSLAEGDRIQIMHHFLDINHMASRVDDFLDRLQKGKPQFALYLDCACRAAACNHMGTEDAVIIQNKLRGRIPLLGVYGGLEIAPILGRPTPMNWAGVLCVLSAT